MESQGLFLGGVKSELSSEGQIRANLMNKVQGRETRGIPGRISFLPGLRHERATLVLISQSHQQNPAGDRPQVQ